MKHSKTSEKKSKLSPSRPFFSHAFDPGPKAGAFFTPQPNASAAVQAKLTIGTPNDRFEREADAVADQVVRRMATSEAQESAPHAIHAKSKACDGTEKPDQQSDASRDDRSGIQAKPDEARTPGGAAERATNAVANGGRPMLTSERSQFEMQFGRDFSNVLIHDRSPAKEAASAIQARAYTFGNHIAFAASQYAPETLAGRKLIAHELTHTIQQGSGEPLAVQRESDEGGQATSQTAIESTLERAGHVGQKTPSTTVALTESVPDSAKSGTTAAVTEPSAESSEAPPQRSELYTIKSRKAWVRDAPKRASSHIRRTLTINNRQAFLRDSENPSLIITPGPSSARLRAGTRLRGTRLTLPLGTEVREIGERKHEGRRYVNVEWNGGDGWLRSRNTSSKVVSIPKGTKVERRGEQGEFTLVRWDSHEGWTATSNLDVEIWDMTYATRFRSEGKRDLETTSPKTVRLLFEEDGTLALGTVAKRSANKRKADNLAQWLPGSLPKNTRCLVLEQKGRYLRVLDYGGAWDADASPPGWWTSASNIKRFAGRVNLDEISNDVVRDYIEANQTERSAAETDVRVAELRATGQRVGHVRSNRAIVRDAEGNSSKVKLAYPALVVALEEKTLPAGAATPRVIRVFPLEAESEEKEVWTAPSNVRFWRSEVGYSVEAEEDQLFLVMRMKQAATRNDRYPISTLAARKLKEAYIGAIDQMIEAKTYTRGQRELLLEAKAFAASRGPQAVKVPELKISARAIRDPEGKDDGLRLNADLIGRMKLFYRFIYHKGLIAAPPKWVGGIRARTVAHEKSTKWTLNPKSRHMKDHERRLEFARRLVSMRGEPDVAGIDWLLPDEIRLLEECLNVLRSPDKFEQSWLFSLITNHTIEEIVHMAPFLFSAGTVGPMGIVPSKEPTETQNPLSALSSGQSFWVNGVHLLVDELIKVSQSNVTLVGNMKSQGAQAAEGYPEEEAWGKRRPNINDRTGVSNHCGGEAIDVTFPFVFNYFDPIIDAVALYFGLYRPVKEASITPEYWHYERIGTTPGQRTESEPTIDVQEGGGGGD